MKLYLIVLIGLILLVIPQPSLAMEIKRDRGIETNVYTPSFDTFNVKEQMTLTPIFTPDNALDAYAAWIKKANSTIEIQNQYITQFDDSVSWAEDPSPLVRELVNAKNRGVTIRVQVREDSDSDDVTSYFLSVGIDVRWMGNSGTAGPNGYLSSTHNKLLIIDHKVTLLSSINFGENAFTNNREAGIIIQSSTVSNYYLDVFNLDWDYGEIPSTTRNRLPDFKNKENLMSDYPSHTNIPLTNFTGTYNVTAFVNPDNADNFIFKYLNSAKKSIYVSMYTISRPDFNNTLIALKKANPSLDIQVLISNRRVGQSENKDTIAAAKSLVANLIPVYNSTKDDDKVNGFYHNKYWIIDGKHTFVYSGNWSPRSVTPAIEAGESYPSSEPNRDMGLAVLDAPDIAAFYKNVWDQDVAVADAWELPVGIKQTSFYTSQVLSGTVTITGVVTGLPNATISYKWNSNNDNVVTANANGEFSFDFDTTTLDNGINTLFVTATTETQQYSDSIKVNIVNADDWRLLITELFPNPSEVSDAEGEFIEITNSFSFDMIISGWQAGDDNDLITFPDNYIISGLSSIIIARDLSAFSSAYNVNGDFELSFSLTNSGDYVQLLNPEGTYIDVVAYGDVTAPDGSEVLNAPDAGESIQRYPIYIDTNKASDFITGLPNPKAEVIVSSSLTTSPTTTSTVNDTTSNSTVPIPFVTIIVTLPIIAKKRLDR